MAVLEIWYSADYSMLYVQFSSFQGDIAKPFKKKNKKRKNKTKTTTNKILKKNIKVFTD